MNISPKFSDQSPVLDSAMSLLDKVQSLISTSLSEANSKMDFFDYLPIPAWVKDIHGNIVIVNRAYKDVYPVEESFLPNVHVKFSSVIMEQHLVNDLWVVNYQRPRIFTEAAPTKNDPERISKFLKFPIFSGEGVLVGVAGIELSAATKKEIDQCQTNQQSPQSPS